MSGHNPPAYPQFGMAFGEDPYLQGGMTLRDWFAGQVLPTAAGEKVDGVEPWMVAKLCYMIADAMLAERAKGGDQ